MGRTGSCFFRLSTVQAYLAWVERGRARFSFAVELGRSITGWGRAGSTILEQLFFGRVQMILIMPGSSLFE